METIKYTRRNPYRRRRQSTVTIPQHACPHARLVFAEMRRQNVSYDLLEERSGVLRTTIKAWRHKNKPGLDSIEAALGALGFDFVPIPRAKVLPADFATQLTPIAERFGLTMQGATEALVALVVRVHERFAVGELAPSVAPSLEDTATA